jgi:hypothetical protein
MFLTCGVVCDVVNVLFCWFFLTRFALCALRHDCFDFFGVVFCEDGCSKDELIGLRLLIVKSDCGSLKFLCDVVVGPFFFCCCLYFLKSQLSSF